MGKPRKKKLSQTQFMMEQMALMFSSVVWTLVTLAVIVFAWAMNDLNENWEVIYAMAPSPTAAMPVTYILPGTPTGTPMPSPTPTFPPTYTPTFTPIPSATPTRVIQPPSILPDTPNQDDPTPIAVMIRPSAVSTRAPTATPVPPTATPRQDQAPVAIDADADMPPTPTKAAPILNPDRLVINSVGIDSEVIPVGWQVVEQDGNQYSIWEVADYAVGWHKTTAIPGEVGNTVLAGHHNISGEVFRDLVNVEVGDEVTVYAGDQTLTYKIEMKTIVKEKGEALEVRQENAKWIAPTTDERLTMVTCWPYTNNTHRVIVVAKPVAGPTLQKPPS